MPTHSRAAALPSPIPSAPSTAPASTASHYCSASDERNLTRELGRARFQKSKRSRVRCTARLDCQPKVILGSIASGFIPKLRYGPCSEALIDRKDHHPSHVPARRHASSGAPGWSRFRVIRRIVREDLFTRSVTARVIRDSFGLQIRRDWCAGSLEKAPTRGEHAPQALFLTRLGKGENGC